VRQDNGCITLESNIDKEELARVRILIRCITDALATAVHGALCSSEALFIVEDEVGELEPPYLATTLRVMRESGPHELDEQIEDEQIDKQHRDE
jgi:hypothetical protein